MQFSAIVFILLLTRAVLCSTVKSRVIRISQGSLYGSLVTVIRTRGVIEKFLGVPYAVPPASPYLRFMPPVSPDSWRGLRDCRYLPPECPQLTASTSYYLRRSAHVHKLTSTAHYSEDCLYLNIYAPVFGKSNFILNSTWLIQHLQKVNDWSRRKGLQLLLLKWTTCILLHIVT